MPTYLTTGQAAQQLRISRWTLRRAADRGDLMAIQRTPGGWLQFAPAEVERYARRLVRSSPTTRESAGPADARAQPVGAAHPHSASDPVALAKPVGPRESLFARPPHATAAPFIRGTERLPRAPFTGDAFPGRALSRDRPLDARTRGVPMDTAVRRLLLVEDDDDDYLLTRALLAEIPGEAYVLDRVSTFQEGLAVVGEHRHDAYLVDYRLGAESGLDLLRVLRREGRRAPIILLTGQGDGGVDIAAMEAGATDYLVKGEVTAAELERALRYAHAQEQHLAETDVAIERLRTSEQFALATLDALPEHIAILDEEGVILAVNAAWRRFALANGGREGAEGVGQNYVSVCAKAAARGDEQGARAANGITDVLHGRATSFALEYPCHSPTEKRWFTMEAAPFVGEGPGRVVVSHHNITTRIEAQEELGQREGSFRLLFQANPQPMWVFDADTLRFLEVNDAAVEHYGCYTRDEFLAMRITDIRPPEDVSLLQEAFGRHAGALWDSGVWRHHTKDGRRIDVAITTHTLTFEGRAARLVLAQDITARKQVEEDLRRSEARIQAGIEWFCHRFDELGFSVT